MRGLVILFFAFIHLGAKSQAEIHYNGSPVSSELTLSQNFGASLPSSFNPVFYFVNTTNSSIQVTYSRLRNYHVSGWTDQTYDEWMGLLCDDSTHWFRPEFTCPNIIIEPGDSSIFNPKVFPEGADGCAIYTYYLRDVDFNILDSIQITFNANGSNCFLKTVYAESNNDIIAYPNPANDVLYIELSSSGNHVVTFYDLLGNIVHHDMINSGLNQINIESLKPGIYLYSIRKDNQLVQMKKLIIE